MRHWSVLLALAVTATGARASDAEPWRAGGAFAGIGVGAAALMQNGATNSPGLTLEGKAGFAHPLGVSVFASGAVTLGDMTPAFCGTSPCSPYSLRYSVLAVNLEYRLVMEALEAAPFVRATFGMGFGDIPMWGGNPYALSQVAGSGLAWGGGLGVEWRLSSRFALAPEAIFRNSALGYGSYTVVTQSLGFQLNALYY